MFTITIKPEGKEARTSYVTDYICIGVNEDHILSTASLNNIHNLFAIASEMGESFGGEDSELGEILITGLMAGLKRDRRRALIKALQKADSHDRGKMPDFDHIKPLFEEEAADEEDH